MLGDKFIVELNRADYELFQLMGGVATSTAMEQKDNKLAYLFVQLINRINKKNPHFKQYEIPKEFREVR